MSLSILEDLVSAVSASPVQLCLDGAFGNPRVLLNVGARKRQKLSREPTKHNGFSSSSSVLVHKQHPLCVCVCV